MRGRALILSLGLLTGTGVLGQWILVWTGLFPVVEEVPGFRNYFLSFQAADMWLVGAGLLAAYFALKRDARGAVFFGVALGSAMLFFGLYAFMYDLKTGLLFDMSSGELFGKAVTLYNLGAGALLMFVSWRAGSPGAGTPA